ncbi:MAG: helix-turn-helix transcriptional regulator [Ruminococcaceae bacterium]|nr:helix-turn-helix transcriptional regulator [Oscillospiraceae bacterium]
MRRAIVKATTYGTNEIKTFFLLTTGNTLDWYFRQRRLYHAFGQIIKYRDKSIGAIANFYGYSDSASFNHAFRQAFSVTPTQARNNPELVKDNRLVYGDFQQTAPTKQTIDDLSEKEIQHMIDLYEYEERGSEEYGFSSEISCEIATLAEKLGIPGYMLMDTCFDLIVDIQSDPDYIPPKIETAIEFDINSLEELDEICQYYDCRYFELNSSMVDYYRQNAGKLDEE